MFGDGGRGRVTLIFDQALEPSNLGKSEYEDEDENEHDWATRKEHGRERAAESSQGAKTRSQKSSVSSVRALFLRRYWSSIAFFFSSSR
jgi:hypothetical protein